MTRLLDVKRQKENKKTIIKKTQKNVFSFQLSHFFQVFF